MILCGKILSGNEYFSPEIQGGDSASGPWSRGLDQGDIALRPFRIVRRGEDYGEGAISTPSVSDGPYHMVFQFAQTLTFKPDLIGLKAH